MSIRKHSPGKPTDPVARSALSGSEARLVRIMGLMTDWHGCCVAHQAPAAEQIAQQCDLLARDSQVCAEMRAFAQCMHLRWQLMAQQCQRGIRQDTAARGQSAREAGLRDPGAPAARWHDSTKTLQ